MERVSIVDNVVNLLVKVLSNKNINFMLNYLIWDAWMIDFSESGKLFVIVP